MLQGYKTIIAMTFALIFAVCESFGIVVPQDEQSGLQVGVLAVIGIALRVWTSTSLFRKE